MSPYRPPAGYYDLPFTWVYDAQNLTNGQNFLNQRVYLQGGYGDFLLRRVVGMDRVLNPAGGSYRIEDRTQTPLQSDQVLVTGLSDFGILPEILYPETGKIPFDLYDVLKTTEQSQVNPIYSAQVAFQGVRRMKGKSPFDADYKFRHPSFIYKTTGSIPAAQNADGSSTGLTPIYCRVTDYGFDLYAMSIFYSSRATGVLANEQSSFLTFAAVEDGAAGNGVTITIDIPLAINQPLTIDVVGQVVNILIATDGSGSSITTGDDIGALIAGTPAAAALMTVSVTDGTLGTPLGTSIFSGGGVAAPGCNSAIWLYDQDRVTIQSQPALDIFMNIAGTTAAGDPSYQNGSIVPPLHYRKDSSIRADFQSLSANPLSVEIYYIGRQRIPC